MHEYRELYLKSLNFLSQDKNFILGRFCLGSFAVQISLEILFLGELKLKVLGLSTTVCHLSLLHGK